MDMDTDDPMRPAPWLELTEACHHYTSKDAMPADVQKYWHQRNTLFSDYDHYDVFLTDAAWYGVTPEPVANQIALDLPLPRGLADDADTTAAVVVDLFAGVGGNTIAFARSGRWGHVLGIEQDAATLACAQHNAALYGVEACITWIHGDCLDFLHRLHLCPETLDPALRVDRGATVIFASPPWGGTAYLGAPVFDLSTMPPYSLATLHAACQPLPHALYLPRTSDLEQLAAVTPVGQRTEVVQYCIHRASKALVAYFGGEEVEEGGETSADSTSESESLSESSSSEEDEEEEEEDDDDKNSNANSNASREHDASGQ